LGEANKAKTTATASVAIFHDNLSLKNQIPFLRSFQVTTYRFLDLTKLLEFGTKGSIISVPRKATTL
jgi:hypothetical protein